MAQPQPKHDIDELAHRFIYRDYSFRGIANKFGHEPARTAVKQMASVVLLIEPDNNRAQLWAGLRD